ncbi:MAG: thioredoxin fold domain-containing protein [Pseudomonadota bacterium]|nr:MAG: thioredoxin fold domain-containing protein [Pseudomonadota bacterium]
MPHHADHTLATSLQRFTRDVIEASSQRPLLVDFWAEWCPPCLQIVPALGKVITHYEGRIGLVKVEVDDGENMKLAGRYKVRGFPTIILFHRGEELGRFSGARPGRFIEQFIDEHLPVLP